MNESFLRGFCFKVIAQAIKLTGAPGGDRSGEVLQVLRITKNNMLGSTLFFYLLIL
ncbi:MULTISPECIES: hypothetical protein [unclassified Paenibacillus]|uniref:hypothetical protein n=1 Tax=unclassified Paenibacillus TaxID=185978 RepID=UPI00278028D6|nr:MULTISPECIES: hypothetical protein [unclassified Paenibacillus]MDQ0897629.1 hypothetical protein [Paenibacillus sp. V4I7]MDQ0916365.1 hypothetical protein [Paenibacillus sp. V4I5]